MKVLVAGGTGFVGTYLTEELQKKHEIITIGRSLKNNICIDITDKEQLKKIPKADALVNLAAYIPNGGLSYHETAEETRECIKINTLGTYNLLQIARERKMKFIQSSSLAVFGKNLQQKTNEQTSRMPLSSYGLSKHLADCFCELHNVTILCYSSIYGYGQKKNSVIPLFIEQAKDGKDIVVFGAGQRSMDFVYVKDVVQANIKALESKTTGFFTIGSGTATTMLELAEKVKVLFGTQNCTVKRDFKKEEEKIQVSMDIRRANKLLGYAPTYSMDDGLQDYKRMLNE
ncbi:MAG TPA: NAD(P)-dependent oxidoreductase [Candidatus Nanoarchaeia archaeon]|nr:NAD(P)-dependent oxidoreductase [Candidatus Nanoarchaeia archaeon]